MITHINYEVFSPAMKAKLDPTYRRVLQAKRYPRTVRFWKILAKVIMKRFSHSLRQQEHMALIRGDTL